MEKSLKTKIVTLALVFALCMCAVLTIIFVPAVGVYSGLGNNGLRFKQVALGEDFAIGLTYDGDLYGWDLKEFDATHNNKLGLKYGTKPKEIEVKFTPGYTVGADNTIVENSPQSTKDKIVKIAATRESAAFITENNYIYTWGHNTFVSTSSLGLCLTAKDSVAYITEPTMVDYDLTSLSNEGDFTDLRLMLPGYSSSSPSGQVSGFSIAHSPNQLLDIVGSDNSYVVKHVRGASETSAGQVCFFGWGSSRYLTAGTAFANTGGEDKLSTYMYSYHYARSTATAERSNVALGGGTLLIANDSKLFVRGKNFYVPSGRDNYEYEIGTKDFSDDIHITEGNALYLDTILNLFTNKEEQDYGSETVNRFTEAGYYARINVTVEGTSQYAINEGLAARAIGGASSPNYEFFQVATKRASSSGSDPYYNGGVLSSNTASLTTASNSKVVDIFQTSVSLGNGYGYVIDGSGKLWFFGNGYNGQKGLGEKKGYDNLSEVTLGAGESPISVVAGKTTMGDPVYRDLGSADAGGTAFRGTMTDGGKLKLGGYDDDTAGRVIESCADGDEFLSGLIVSYGQDAGNRVYVWNKDKERTDISGKFAGANGTDNKIVQLFAGYGNNLVAISSLGKIYQIGYDATANEGAGDFTVDVKDSFVDKEGGQIVNYAINNSNVINFAISNSRPSKAGEEQGSAVYATFSLDSLSASAATGAVVSNIDAYTSVVTDKNSADSFRILRPVDENLPDRMISSGNLINAANIGVPDNGAPVFYIEGEEEPLSEALLKHYLRYDFVTDTTTGEVSIRIWPDQSTKDKTIIMNYYVARCGSNTDRIRSIDAESQYKFYDCAMASVKITIANTLASFSEFAYNLATGETSNSSIPVLDPNNTKNNVYSIALTNVLFGLEKFGKEYGLEGDDFTAFYDDIIEQAYRNDEGFPAKQRVQDADLSRFYENGSNRNYHTDSYYNDIYQYFAFDQDGDTLSFDEANFAAYQNAGAYYSVKTKHVTFSLPLADYAFAGLETADDLKLFNNIYGLTLSISNNNLNIGYDVVQLTALASTDISYEKASSDSEDTAFDVRKPNTHYSTTSSAPYYYLFVSETYYSREENANVTRTNSGEDAIIVPASIRASLTMTQTTEDGTPYRAKEGYNEYRLAPIARRVADSTDSGRVYTFNLNTSGLFTDYSYIYLTYAHDGSYTSYTNFVSQFDRTLTNVTLNSTTFTFEAKVPGVYRDIRIEVRRFADTSRHSPMRAGTDDSEVMTLIFDITVNASTFQQTVEVNGGKVFGLQERTITAATPISVDTFSNSAPGAELVTAHSSNDNIATVAVSADGKALTVTPVSSGTVTVSVIVKQNMFSGEGSFTVNVESRSVLPESIKLRDSATIYLADLKAAIAKTFTGEEVFKFEDYSIDKTSDPTLAPNGYYFVRGVTNANGTMTWEPISKPDFVDTVTIVNDINTGKENAITLTLGKYKATDDFSNIMLVVKFVSTTKRFESAVSVSPAKQALMMGNDELVVNVAVQGGVVQAGEMGTVSQDQSQIRLSIGELLTYANIPAAQYRIQLVAPVYNNSFDYFGLALSGNSEVVITPVSNTVSATDTSIVEPQQVNIVIADTNGNSYVLTLFITISGIKDRLDLNTYITIWAVVAACVFLVLLIIFIVRMGIYWKRKAEQKRIIRKNQMLIKMRDKVHNKSETVSKEQIVQTKLKLEDPKYAKMFNEMKKASEEKTISLDDDTDPKGKKKKKNKKNGKKSLAELQAELAAKKEALAKMQMGAEMPMNDIPTDASFAQNMDAGFGEPTNAPFDSFESVMPDMGGAPINDNINSDDNILFDVETLDDNK